MKNLTRHLWLAVALLAIANPAWADDPDFKMKVDCPPDASAGSMITVDVSLENRECSPLNVRLMSSISGNANQTVGGMGIWGPVLVDTMTVDAATDLLPGTCDLTRRNCDGGGGANCSTDADCAGGICQTYGECADTLAFCTSDLDCNPGVLCEVFYRQCNGDWTPCNTDADCLCRYVTPVITNDSILTPPAIPVGLEGTVATFVMIAKGDIGLWDETEVGQCIVNVLP